MRDICGYATCVLCSCSQLRSDGLDKLAKTVADEVLQNETSGPSEQLESLVKLGGQAEERQQGGVFAVCVCVCVVCVPHVDALLARWGACDSCYWVYVSVMENTRSSAGLSVAALAAAHELDGLPCSCRSGGCILMPARRGSETPTNHVLPMFNSRVYHI